MLQDPCTTLTAVSANPGPSDINKELDIIKVSTAYRFVRRLILPLPIFPSNLTNMERKAERKVLHHPLALNRQLQQTAICVRAPRCNLHTDKTSLLLACVLCKD